MRGCKRDLALKLDQFPATTNKLASSIQLSQSYTCNLWFWRDNWDTPWLSRNYLRTPSIHKTEKLGKRIRTMSGTADHSFVSFRNQTMESWSPLKSCSASRKLQQFCQTRKQAKTSSAARCSNRVCRNTSNMPKHILWNLYQDKQDPYEVSALHTSA